MAEKNTNSALNPVEDTLPPWETELKENPDSALNPAWDITPKSKEDKADFAVVPPSKYTDGAPIVALSGKKSKDKAPKEKKGNSKKIIIPIIAIVLIAAIAAVIVLVGLPLLKYQKANRLFAAGNYEGAISTFKELGDYKDSKQKIEMIKEAKRDDMYTSARDLFDEGNYKDALDKFTELGDYKESAEFIKKCNYELAVEQLEYKNYDKALELFVAAETDAADKQFMECKYQFCLADKTNSSDVYAMLKELKEAKYKDAAKIMSERFKWSIKTVINTDSEDAKTNETTVDAEDMIYCHFTVDKGVEGETIKLKATYTWPGAEEKEIDLGGKEFKIGEGATLYTYNTTGKNDEGKLTFTFYDDAGTKIAEASVTVE